MLIKKQQFALVGLSSLIAVCVVGCGQKDPTITAAPPPAANAHPLPMVVGKKPMPIPGAVGAGAQGSLKTGH